MTAALQLAPELGVVATCAALGVDRATYYRHRAPVHGPNPFSEAHFKTMKYRPDFPERFGEIEDARGYSRDFFGWYNDEHHHAGIGMLTPADVHHGLIDLRIAERQAALDIAFASHPERFPRGRPIAQRPPREVWINQPQPAPGATAATGDAQRSISAAAAGVTDAADTAPVP